MDFYSTLNQSIYHLNGSEEIVLLGGNNKCRRLAFSTSLNLPNSFKISIVKDCIPMPGGQVQHCPGRYFLLFISAVSSKMPF